MLEEPRELSCKGTGFSGILNTVWDVGYLECTAKPFPITFFSLLPLTLFLSALGLIWRERGMWEVSKTVSWFSSH